MTTDLIPRATPCGCWDRDGPGQFQEVRGPGENRPGALHPEHDLVAVALRHRYLKHRDAAAVGESGRSPGPPGWEGRRPHRRQHGEGGGHAAAPGGVPPSRRPTMRRPGRRQRCRRPPRWRCAGRTAGRPTSRPRRRRRRCPTGRAARGRRHPAPTAPARPRRRPASEPCGPAVTSSRIRCEPNRRYPNHCRRSPIPSRCRRALRALTGNTPAAVPGSPCNERDIGPWSGLRPAAAPRRSAGPVRGSGRRPPGRAGLVGSTTVIVSERSSPGPTGASTTRTSILGLVGPAHRGGGLPSARSGQRRARP
jgi:hypothetical protein